jgi:hypothetical protein
MACSKYTAVITTNMAECEAVAAHSSTRSSLSNNFLVSAKGSKARDAGASNH